MDTINPDRLAYEAFTLAFRIQKILESNLIPQEAKDDLTRDFSHLKEKVGLLTDYRKQREQAQGFLKIGTFSDLF